MSSYEFLQDYVILDSTQIPFVSWRGGYLVLRFLEVYRGRDYQQEILRKYISHERYSVRFCEYKNL